MNKLLYFFIMVLFIYKTGTAQEVGAPAPEFTHNTLSHGTISLSDYQGQVVYLFFFGWG
jgi:peroxiredoxin